jgi:hypothetical protein
VSAVVIVMILGGLIAAVIAQDRNRSAFGWALLGALFPILGIVMVYCLPPNPPDES